MAFLIDVAAAFTALIPAETSIYPSNAEPPAPDNTLTLYGAGGPQAVTDLSGNVVQEDRTVQLRFRDAAQGNLQARVENAYSILRTWNTYVATGATVRLKASGPPLYSYPKDANNRSIASFNVTVKYGS